jgi:hypothetical protein
MLPSDVPEYSVRTKLSPVEHWRHVAEIVALITAAVWAFYVFVYQERIKPAGEPPRLQFSTSVTHQALQDGKELVTVGVTMKNTGATDISMGAVLVNAYGVRYKRDVAGITQQIQPASGITIVNRGLSNDTPALLYSHLSLWKAFGANRQFKLNVGEEVRLDEPFVIKRGAYDTLRTTDAHCYQRSDDAAVVAYSPKRAPDQSFNVVDIVANGRHAGMTCAGSSYYTGEYAL